jgi:hypothetical protein
MWGVARTTTLPVLLVLRIDTAQHASRVARDDGAHLRQAIEQAWHDAGPIVLDFEGLTIASVSFFDEALGVLALDRADLYSAQPPSAQHRASSQAMS